MKLIFNIILFTGIGIAGCPEGLYEDDCGTCWMPYCYDFTSHNILYDIEQNECNEDTEIWVIPGSEGDLFFNSYCNGNCPDSFMPDDCNSCWSSFCYTFFPRIFCHFFLT